MEHQKIGMVFFEQKNNRDAKGAFNPSMFAKIRPKCAITSFTPLE